MQIIQTGTEKWWTGTVEKTAGRRISFIASHEKVDRDGEVILVAGIDTSEFLRNPVLMRQHDRRTVVGQVDFLRKTVVDGVPALIGEATFPDRPQSLDTLADIQAGLLNAVSIGFLAVERGAPMHPTQRGSTYTKTTLLEVSVVALPACATCVITGKGLTQCASCSTPGDDVDVLELDDESEHVFQSPAVIRRIIRDTVREGLRETVQRGIKKELNRLRGRLD